MGYHLTRTMRACGSNCRGKQIGDESCRALGSVAVGNLERQRQLSVFEQVQSVTPAYGEDSHSPPAWVTSPHDDAAGPMFEDTTTRDLSARQPAEQLLHKRLIENHVGII